MWGLWISLTNFKAGALDKSSTDLFCLAIVFCLT